MMNDNHVAGVQQDNGSMLGLSTEHRYNHWNKKHHAGATRSTTNCKGTRTRRRNQLLVEGATSAQLSLAACSQFNTLR